MLTIRGVYDGKTFRALPDEPLPEVEGEVLVTIIFEDLKDDGAKTLEEKRRELLANAINSRDLLPPELRLSPEEAARDMDELRERIGPLGFSVTELIDESRREME